GSWISAWPASAMSAAGWTSCRPPRGAAMTPAKAGGRPRGAPMTAASTGEGRGHGGSDGTGAARLSTLTRLAFLGGPMLSMIDSSVVNIAVPDIVADLHTSLGTAAWTVSGYLLGLAAGLAATPWLARRFGTLPAYQAALAGFIAT